MIILFDLDGTLIDSTDAIVESFHYACDTYGYKRVSQEEIEKLIGYPLDVMFSAIGVSEDVVWDFVAKYKEHYRKVSKQKTHLLPQAKETLELAASFARLGVVTTKTARYSKELLEHFGVMHYFETLIGREDVTNPKPHKEPILKALEAMGVDSTKEHSVIIGDTKLDLMAAKSANIDAVGVLCGYGTKETLEQFGYPLCSDAYEAVKLLKKRKNNTR